MGMLGVLLVHIRIVASYCKANRALKNLNSERLCLMSILSWEYPGPTVESEDFVYNISTQKYKQQKIFQCHVSFPGGTVCIYIYIIYMGNLI